MGVVLVLFEIEQKLCMSENDFEIRKFEVLFLSSSGILYSKVTEETAVPFFFFFENK